MQTYRVTLEGVTPLLQHHDNIEWADQMEEWRSQPENKDKSRPGDDRTPAFQWLGTLYHDGEWICLPTDNLKSVLKDAGAMLGTGKGTKTFKEQTQSGTLFPDEFWPLEVGGKRVPVQPFFDRKETRTFAEYRKLAAAYAFGLHVKRAVINGKSKHVRVRPQFHEWKASGLMHVIDDQLTEPVLRTILTAAGRRKGLCDWRPGGKTPGSYGTFKADIELVIET